MNVWKVEERKISYTTSFDSSMGRNKTITLSEDERSFYLRVNAKEIQCWDLQNCEKLGVIDLSFSQMYDCKLNFDNF